MAHLKMGQTRPLFVYFRPLLNSMTNTVQNLIMEKVSTFCLGLELGSA